MLNNFFQALFAVLPSFILMSIGYGIKHIGLLDNSEVKRLNNLVFKLCFGPLLFCNIYESNIGEAFNVSLVTYSVFSVFAIFFLGMAISLLIEKKPESRGAMIQAIYRSNFVVMGVPVVSNLYGGKDLASTSLILAVIVPIYNILAVVTLETFRGGRPPVLHVIRDVLKNPLLIGGVLGAIFSGFGIRLPVIVETPLFQLRDIGSPMALILLGAFFDVQNIKECLRNLIVCVSCRLVVMPLIFLSIAVAIGFRGPEFATLVAMLAAPCASASFTMAQSMGSDAKLAGNCVVFSTLFSCFTMFGWIFLFKTLGVF